MNQDIMCHLYNEHFCMKTSSGQTDFSLENLLLGDVSNEKNHKPLFRIYWTQTNKQKKLKTN